MATYQLTNKAEREIEIEGIYEYSILNFGLRVAQEYMSGLTHCLELLADNLLAAKINLERFCVIPAIP